MPSPFPGMDPYLEAPDIWPDLHDRLANEISTALNVTLPAPYYARLEMRPEVGIVEDEGEVPRRIVPDIAVVRHWKPQASSDSGAALLERPRAMISPFTEVRVLSEPMRHPFVEIRDPARGHRLVCLLEIASPSNKHLGPDRDAYQRKQREVLASDASLIELDLLRSGKRVFAMPELEANLSGRIPQVVYLVSVSRAWQRAEEHGPRFHLFGSALTEKLPCIPVPLRADQPDLPLDLQFAFQRAYDAGPYRRGAVDYTVPPRPALPESLTAWADERLRAAGMR